MFSKNVAKVVGFVVNFLGLLGLFPAIYYLLSLIATTNSSGQAILWMGKSIDFWTAVLGSSLVAVTVIFLVFVSMRQDRLYLQGLYADSQKRIADLEGKALQLSERHHQKELFELLSKLFGYFVSEVVVDYKIEADGSAQLSQTVSFQCTRRSLGSWQRVLQSSQGVPSASASRVMDGVTITPKVEKKGPLTIETLEFDPTLRESDGVKSLQLIDRHQTIFITPAKVRTGDRNGDWVSFAPNEPIKKLTLLVEFEGFEPKDVTCTALRGRTRDVISSEAAEVELRMSRGLRNTHRFYAISIDYPIIGVSYRLDWKLI
jgi:hypothetical protein